MKKGLGVFWKAIRDTYHELPVLLPINLVTLLLMVPVVTGPPALVGLWAVGNRVAKGMAVGWRDYFRAFREHLGRAWALAGFHLLVWALVLSNLRFYAPTYNPLGVPEGLTPYVQGLFLALLFVWSLLFQYTFPLLLEQEDRRIGLVLRNAGMLLAAEPVLAVTILLLSLLVSLLSTLLMIPWLFITPAFLAILTNHAVLRLLEPYREEKDE